jgi:hypothetical protein
MKKVPLVLVFLLVTILLASCAPPLPPLPTKPNEVLPFCKALYEIQLELYPDYPHAFVGACVQYYQTGKSNAMVSLCGYEPFRESIGVNTREECKQYIFDQSK